MAKLPWLQQHSPTPHSMIKPFHPCQHCLAVSSPELLWSHTKMKPAGPWSSSLLPNFVPTATEVQTKQLQYTVCSYRGEDPPKPKLTSFFSHIKKEKISFLSCCLLFILVLQWFSDWTSSVWTCLYKLYWLVNMFLWTVFASNTLPLLLCHILKGF